MPFQLKQYLASLGGIPLDQVEVITGSRIWPDLRPQAAEPGVDLEAVSSIGSGCPISPERFEALERSRIARGIRHAIVSSEKPLDLNDLIQAVQMDLTASNQLARQREVLAWLDMLTSTRPSEGEPPFLSLRMHVFQRMLHGLWSCVNSECPRKSPHLETWPFGNVYVTQRSRCDCEAPDTRRRE